MISKFNPRYHANLKTPNNRLPSFRHRKAKQWYAELLGFPPYFDEPFYIGFNVKGFELGLQPKEGAVKTKSEGVNTYWGIEDVEATFQKLISMGATEHEKPTDVGGGIQVAMVQDP